MNWEIFTNSKLVENIGWTLLHSFWQIAFAALLLFLLLRVFRQCALSRLNFRPLRFDHSANRNLCPDRFGKLLDKSFYHS